MTFCHFFCPFPLPEWRNFWMAHKGLFFWITQTFYSEKENQEILLLRMYWLCKRTYKPSSSQLQLNNFFLSCWHINYVQCFLLHKLASLELLSQVDQTFVVSYHFSQCIGVINALKFRVTRRLLPYRSRLS